jgi:hypothetical protein
MGSRKHFLINLSGENFLIFREEFFPFLPGEMGIFILEEFFYHKIILSLWKIYLMKIEKMLVEYEGDYIIYYQDQKEEYFCSFYTLDNRLIINGEFLDGQTEKEVVTYIEKDLHIKVKNYLLFYKKVDQKEEYFCSSR